MQISRCEEDLKTAPSMSVLRQSRLAEIQIEVLLAVFSASVRHVWQSLLSPCDLVLSVKYIDLSTSLVGVK